MHTKKLVVGVFSLLVLVVGYGVYSIVADRFSLQDGVPQVSDHKNATYTIGGRSITLSQGMEEIESAPGSASKTLIRYFGNELRKDLDGDGDEDVAFLVTEDSGGSGTFFYVVMALRDENGYRGSDALFIGDRIAPQNITDGPERSVLVNYADRNPGENMSTPPSQGKSITVLLNPQTMKLGELIRDFEGESNIGGKLKADVFTGTLEEVNTGCFADGECYVVVGGKHVTALMGWSRDEVGTVQGVEGFGDLESHIGKQVEVYAQDLQDGTYTLYGSKGFYIKLLQGNVSGRGSEPGQGIAVGEPHPGSSGDDPGDGDEPKPQVVQGGCMVGGCSGQVCGDARTVGDVVTTCEYRAEYACYQVARCERQSNGQCGWTETPELVQCLRDSADQPVMVEYQTE